MKVAIAHDFLTTQGGAERVLKALHSLYPEAPVYTLWYDEQGTQGAFSAWDIRAWRTGPLRRAALWRFPMAIESFDLNRYDLVISSSSAFAKSILTNPGTTHICYCHTPARYLWDWTHEYLKDLKLGALRRAAASWVIHFMRICDQAYASRPEYWIANYEYIAARIKKYYRASATGIYPPVAMLAPPERVHKENFYLFVGRLSAYKRADLAIAACRITKEPLVIVGEGTAQQELARQAQGTKTVFRGRVNDHELARLYAQARAVIFPSDDDFGIVPVEALAAGTPVIAYAKGGALETVTDETGVFFDQPTSASLTHALKTFRTREREFKPDVLRERAADFSPTRFVRAWRAFINKNLS